jgi:hypothetical protein
VRSCGRFSIRFDGEFTTTRKRKCRTAIGCPAFGAFKGMQQKSATWNA